jgi:hypothetical protein
MRLLTYGGTAFAERCRIGQWSGVQASTLNDADRVVGDRVAYGPVLIGDAMVLAYRERQNVEHRGGYPYTVLLDPGEEQWRRFGWNAGALAAALFVHDGAPGSAILRDPEGMSESRLQELITLLRPLPEKLSLDSPPVFTVLMAAQINAARACSFSPQVFSFAGLPAAAEFGQMLNTVPPAFRMGRGWLVGASAAFAQEMGASIAIDDLRPANDAELQACVADGEVLQEVLEWLKKNVPELYSALASEPLHRWNDLKTIWRDAAILHRLLCEPSDNLFREAVMEDAQGLLSDCVKRAGAEAALSGSGKISAEGTRLILKCCADGLAQLDETGAQRLNYETLLGAILGETGPPAPIQNLETPPDVLNEAWASYVSRGGSDAPHRLRQALKATTNPRNTPNTSLREAAQAAARAGVSLSIWLDFRNGLGAEFASWLKAEALDRLRQKPGATALLDYIAIADDPGGRLLARIDVLVEPAVRGLVADCALLSSPPDDRIQGWLVALAGSPLRTRLSFEVKSRAVYVLGGNPDAWRGFQWLLAALNGERLPAPPLSEGERRMLKFELDQALVEKQNGLHAQDTPMQPVPALAPLVHTLGPLSDQARHWLERAKPPSGDAWQAELWIEDLRACGLDPAANLAGLDYVMDWLEGSSSVRLLDPDKLGREPVEQIFRLLVFGEAPAMRHSIESRGKKTAAEYLCRLLDEWRGKAVRSLIQVLRVGLRLEQQAAVFARRFSDYPVVVTLLDEIGRDEKSGAVVESILDRLMEEKAFRNEVAKFCPSGSLNGGVSIGEKIVWSYLDQHDSRLKKSEAQEHGIAGLGQTWRKFFPRRRT